MIAVLGKLRTTFKLGFQRDLGVAAVYRRLPILPDLVPQVYWGSNSEYRYLNQLEHPEDPPIIFCVFW